MKLMRNTFYHINCGVIQGFPALRKAVTTQVKKYRLFFRCFDIANRLLTRHSPLALSHFVLKTSVAAGWNLFKINLFSVCRNSVESTMAPVCSQLSPSECKSTREYLFHSFFIFSCCFRTGSFISPFKQKLISSTRLL